MLYTGGTIGLFTGMSILSAIEVIYWFGRFFFSAVLCRRKNTVKTDKSVNYVK